MSPMCPLKVLFFVRSVPVELRAVLDSADVHGLQRRLHALQWRLRAQLW